MPADNSGLAKAGLKLSFRRFQHFSPQKTISFLFFCKFEKTKMVFARFGFSWNFRLSYPRLRQALSRYL